MKYEDDLDLMISDDEDFDDGMEEFEMPEDDDDEEFSFYDDDDEELESSEDDDDEEFIGSLVGGLSGPLVSAGSKAIGGLFKRRKRRRVRIRRPRRHNARGSRARISIPTKRGPLNAFLGKKYVTPGELNKALSSVRSDILRTKTEIKRVETNGRKDLDGLRKTTASALSRHIQVQRRLDRRQNRKMKAVEAKLTKKIDDSKQMMLMMSLMQDTPEIDSLKLDQAINVGQTTLNVADTEYSDSNNSLLPFLLMSGDGFGGDNNSLLMALALSGNL